MKSSTLFAMLVLCTASSFAQTAQLPVREAPYIEVTGISETEIVPDEIFIAITIKERLEGKETITIEKQETDLKAGLTGIGVNHADLSVSNANADYMRIRMGRRDVVMQKEYVLKTVTAEMVGKIFDKLDELKIHDAYISQVSHSKIEEFKQEARIEAIKAAKNKADYLLEAIGEKTGQPLIVTETPTISIQGYYMDDREIANNEYRTNYKYAATQDYQNESLQFQKIKLGSQVYVKFEIKAANALHP